MTNLTGVSTGNAWASDVALGDEWQTNRDKYMDQAQPNTQCTHALGRFGPRADVSARHTLKLVSSQRVDLVWSCWSYVHLP